MKKLMMMGMGLAAAMAVAAGDAEKNGSAMMNASAAAAETRNEGGVRALFIGNSITLHGPLAEVGWTNNWGMAASAPEKDYVHIVARELEKRLERPIDLKVVNYADFERGFKTWDFAKTAELAKFDPEVLVIALGENVPELATAEDRLAYRAAFRKLVGAFLDGRRTKPLAAIRGVFWKNEAKDAEMAYVASDYAIPFVKTDCCDEPGMKAAGCGFWHAGVAAHPGDKGMAETAARIVEAIFPSKSEFTAVTVDGVRREVQAMRVSAMEFNRVASGFQRPSDQTQPGSFVKLTAKGATRWRVKSNRAWTNAVVRPLSAKVEVKAAEGELSFTLPKPGYYTLELDDFNRTLEIFVDPANDFAEYRRTATRVYGPGIHLAGLVQLKSHDRVYLDENAVVYGSFQLEQVEDVEIRGYGVICGTTCRRHLPYMDMGGEVMPYLTPIRAKRVKGLKIEGPTVVDSCEWCVALFGCEEVEIAHVKVTGAWRYNTDGIDICNSRKVRVRDSFVHSFDDTIVIKGIAGNYERLPVEDILVERCVCWCGWGRTLENGLETWAPCWRRIEFRDCDLIHNSHAALSVHLGGPCAVEDIAYRQIRIEYDHARSRDQYQNHRDDRYEYAAVKPWIGNWVSFENAKMYPERTQEPYGSFRKVVVEDVELLVEEGVHEPWLGRNFVNGTKLGEVVFRNIKLNGQPYDCGKR